MRSEAPAPQRHEREREAESEDEQDMREYGDDEDDDADWRSHTFQSDGRPLQGNDPLSVHDYQVVDPRASRGSLPASLSSHRERQPHEKARAPKSHQSPGGPSTSVGAPFGRSVRGA